MNTYDFDHTIYDGDSSIDFYKYCVKKHPIIILCIFQQCVGLGLYIANFISKERFKEYFFCFLKRLKNPEKDIEEFWKENIGKVKTFYLEQKKKDDLIISASPEFLIAGACEKLGIVNYIASDVNVKTGKFNGLNCYGEEKKRRFEQAYPNGKISNFYSDSNSDFPVAEMADTAYFVCKDSIKVWDCEFSCQKRKTDYLELIRYSFWGGITTVFNLLMFYLLIILGVNYLVSNIVSYFIAVFVSYFFNKFFVFNKSENTVTNFMKYILVRCISVCVDTFLLYCAVDVCLLNVYFSKIVVSIAVILGTYIANKIFVFRE